MRIVSPESDTGWLSPQSVAAEAAAEAAKPAKPKKQAPQKSEPIRSAAR